MATRTARRATALAVAGLLSMVAAGCQSPTPVVQFSEIRDLGFERSLGSFMGVAESDSGKGRYWYLDWRQDGCSAGIAYWKGVFHDPCVRHDFKWKNLYENDYYHPGVDAWNIENRQYANTTFWDDMKDICNGGFDCNLNAYIFFLGVGAVPHGNICYDHYHYRERRGPIKIKNHPNSSCV